MHVTDSRGIKLVLHKRSIINFNYNRNKSEKSIYNGRLWEANDLTFKIFKFSSLPRDRKKWNVSLIG